jgi:hypothetical protein
MYKILSNILRSTLTAYADEIMGEHQCGFRINISTTDHLHLSNPSEAMGVKRGRLSAVYRL